MLISRKKVFVGKYYIFRQKEKIIKWSNLTTGREGQEEQTTALSEWMEYQILRAVRSTGLRHPPGCIENMIYAIQKIPDYSLDIYTEGHQKRMIFTPKFC